MMRRLSTWSIGVSLVVVLAGCSGDADTVTEASTTEPVESTTTTVDTTTTTIPPTTAPGTSTTLAPAPTTSVPATTTTTPLPPTTAVPTTVPPLAGLVLRDDGIGTIRFGDDADETVTFVAAALGSPTSDTGWVAADAVALCPGEEYRAVEWGVLRLTFGDVSEFGIDRRHFTGWDYGIEGQLGEEPTGLLSANGVGLGTRVDELRDAYPSVQIFEGEEGLFPPTWFVNERFDGFLSGVTDSDLVTVMFGGQRCGG